jgi:hypothetical protein
MLFFSIRLGFSVGALIVLAGCATTYQKDGFSGGFSEVQLGENVWQVSFEGNGYTRGQRAQDLALLRSADLTLLKGYTHFGLAESRASAAQSTYTTPTSSSTNFSGSSYGNSFTGRANTSTYGGNTVFISKPSTVNTVVMFKGQPAAASSVFDASFICNSMAAKYEVTCEALLSKK